MITKQVLPLLIITLLFCQEAICSDIGKVWPSEKKTWVDSEFGYEITQWTNHSAESWHLYFNIESFIDKDHAIIYSKRNGALNLFKLNLQSGEMIQISPDYGFLIGHLQANPVDPTLISYCWQHLYKPGSYPGTIGATPQRIWWINIDGTDGGPVGPQEFGIHRTHEFWFPDGSRIGYSARYIYGPDQGRQFIGSCAPDGSDNYMMELPVKFAHSQMYKDNKHWVVDIHDGMVLTLLTLDDRKVEKIQPLFRHDSSWEGQSSHPHPHFSPDGKIIIFSTDKYGTSNVFSVKINL